MKDIILQDILIDNDYSDGGSKVYEIAKNAITNKEIIVLDMKGVDSVPTIFMNTSFGKLIDEFGLETTKKSFKFRNILKTQVERISKYFKDSEFIESTTL